MKQETQMADRNRDQIINDLLAMPEGERAKWRVNDGCDDIGEDTIATYSQILGLCETWYPDLPDGYTSDDVDEADYLNLEGEMDDEKYYAALLGAYQIEKADENWERLVPSDEWLDNLSQTVICGALCAEARGLRYDSPEAKKILDRWTWDNHWPLVNNDGTLTGDVIESEECSRGDYRNVDDMAMIAFCDLTPDQARALTDDDSYVVL